MALSIYSLFKVNTRNLVRNKATLLRHFNLPPNSIEDLPFHEYELIIEDINSMLKQEEEDRKKDESKQKQQYKMPKMPSVPNYSNIKMPKM